MHVSTLYFKTVHVSTQYFKTMHMMQVLGTKSQNQEVELQAHCITNNAREHTVC